MILQLYLLGLTSPRLRCFRCYPFFLIKWGQQVDREQHIVQDAAEHFAVFTMQAAAERLGISASTTSHSLEAIFLKYLHDAGLTEDAFFHGKYKQYRLNAEQQLPLFVERLRTFYDSRKLTFKTVESEFRNKGLKGDFTIEVSSISDPISVSLKNYIGSGGIGRPQVGSGTFASFAAGFIFERVGVGKYADPRNSGQTFQGSNVKDRNGVLRHMGLPDLIDKLALLDDCQSDMRNELLGPECEFYDGERVARVARQIAAKAKPAVLSVFEVLGPDVVRTTLLERAGLDGKEDALFFDSERFVDSITGKNYHELRQRLNSVSTAFDTRDHGQGIRFEFSESGVVILKVDVPFTINTNGAWYRPKEHYTGFQLYRDKGHNVSLEWGQRRPYKSREIATSTNTYVDLASAGIFAN
jgi:hypothetical protein